MDLIATGLGLFFSHILVDFYFQPSSWVLAKEQKILGAWQLYVHCLLAGLLAVICLFVFSGQFVWLVLPLVAFPHLLIDYWKLRFGKDLTDFFIDQGLHIAHLAVIFAWLVKQQNMNQTELLKIAIVLVGAFLLWMPAGIIIGKLTKRFHQNLSSKDKKKALPEAGRWIGILERLFIFISILVGQFGAIGFLIAAKSILRFSDGRTVENPIRMSEYVLIGSLLSFLFAMVTALACEYLIKLIS